jgi:5-methylcytosine-specific restriction enzyme subunit McrC
MTALIRLPAWSELPAERLTADQAAAIEREGLADVLAGPAPGTWRVRTSSTIGVVLGNGWELRVTPKLAIPRLMFLLGYAADHAGWRAMVSGFEPEDDLFSAIVSGFAWHATWALDRGLLRGYVGREERLVAPRGRVLFARQAATGRGLPLPVEVAYSEFTENVLENRMLLTAALLVARLPRIPQRARRQLHRIRAVLEAVEPLRPWRGVAAPPITRLNQRYAAALRLAELILASASVGERKGAVESTTFVFDMNKVFEDFIAVAFRDAMRRYGGRVEDQSRTHSLDEAGRLRLKPDLAWWSGGRCLAVLDAKYNAIDDGLLRHGDAYQMLAYCVAYGLRRGYLIYARDSGAEPAVHRVRNLGCELVVTTIDVEREPGDVLAQVERLARQVAREALVGGRGRARSVA